MSGLEDYWTGKDEAFVDLVDSDWQRLYFVLSRKFLKHEEVIVTNL